MGLLQVVGLSWALFRRFSSYLFAWEFWKTLVIRSRIAFVMDRLFRRFGLSGKSFIPMLISTGCGVPWRYGEKNY